MIKFIYNLGDISAHLIKCLSIVESSRSDAVASAARSTAASVESGATVLRIQAGLDSANDECLAATVESSRLRADLAKCQASAMDAKLLSRVLSFTQHSIAKDANDSEVFTASSGGAQSVPYRGILHEMQVSMHARTPIFSDSRSTTRLISISASAMKQAIYLARRVLYMREGIDDGEYAFY